MAPGGQLLSNCNSDCFLVLNVGVFRKSRRISRCEMSMISEIRRGHRQGCVPAWGLSAVSAGRETDEPCRNYQGCRGQECETLL